MTAIVEEKKTVDILIKGVDAIALMDLMDTIHAYKLKYSISPDDSIDCDNDLNFTSMMETIIYENDSLPVAMEPLVISALTTFDEYVDDYYNDNKDEYKELIKKGEEIQYTE